MDGKIIAFVTRDEYAAIHAYCAARDVEKGGPDDIYDAPSGGAINVWSRAGWDDKEQGQIFCSFIPERADGPDNFGDIVESFTTDPEVAGWLADRKEGDALVFVKTLFSLFSTGWKWVAVTFLLGDYGAIVDGQAHFHELYRRVLGREIPPQRLLRIRKKDIRRPRPHPRLTPEEVLKRAIRRERDRVRKQARNQSARPRKTTEETE